MRKAISAPEEKELVANPNSHDGILDGLPRGTDILKYRTGATDLLEKVTVTV